ncbi:MAG: hypothetical protein E6R08_10105 [Nevskiaceae bacterium]|nr:MAG: hypothetical protein E6R08_10105 [Nevskiaceae bacterium]
MSDITPASVVADKALREATRQLALRVMEEGVAITRLVAGAHQPQDEIYLGGKLRLVLDYAIADPAVQCTLVASSPSRVINRWFLSPNGAGLRRVITDVRVNIAMTGQIPA